MLQDGGGSARFMLKPAGLPLGFSSGQEDVQKRKDQLLLCSS